MANLLKETIDVLTGNDKSPKEVMWVGNRAGYAISWEQFTEIADIEYEDGYGCAEVYKDLLVVGPDFWLERHEYDGAEWWEFKQMPVLNLPLENHTPFYTVTSDEFDCILGSPKSTTLPIDSVKPSLSPSELVFLDRLLEEYPDKIELQNRLQLMAQYLKWC